VEPPYTLSLEAFWSWIVLHPNCILRAGTPEVVVYDDDDLHWYLGPDSDDTLLVQALHGKRALAEIFIDTKQVTHVQALAGERPGEHVFELVSATEGEPFSPWFFVMIHGYDDEETAAGGGRVH